MTACRQFIIKMNCPDGHKLHLRCMNCSNEHELPAAWLNRAIQIMEHEVREIMKPKASIHDAKRQFI